MFYPARSPWSRTTKARAPQNGATYLIKAMTTPLSFLAELQSRISEVLQQSPAKDLEKNMKAMLNQGFSRLDLLTRDEFEVQAEVLARTRARLEALEARVAELESRHTS